jgi:hypothetical protein
MKSIFGLVATTLTLTFALTGAAFAQLPLEPPHYEGQGVTGAFEGWFKNPDGSFSILVGYYNRNEKEPIDIPIGPNNKVEPGGPDMGQPTHFEPGRQWGVVTFKVPANFGQKKLIWTITANGHTMAIPVHLNDLWIVQPYLDATDNTPPWISFDEGQKGVQGPPLGIVKNMTATVGEPLTLTAFLADDVITPPLGGGFGRGSGAPVNITWMKYRGAGDVKFAENKPKAEKIDAKSADPKMKYTGKATTTATFSAPGEYVLEAVITDLSGPGGGGFQCCWTSAQVKVTVKAGK